MNFKRTYWLLGGTHSLYKYSRKLYISYGAPYWNYDSVKNPKELKVLKKL